MRLLCVVSELTIWHRTINCYVLPYRRVLFPLAVFHRSCSPLCRVETCAMFSTQLSCPWLSSLLAHLLAFGEILWVKLLLLLEQNIVTPSQSSSSYSLYIPFSMFPTHRYVLYRCIHWDWVPQLCILLVIVFCSGLYLLHKEVSLKTILICQYKVKCLQTVVRDFAGFVN